MKKNQIFLLISLGSALAIALIGGGGFLFLKLTNSQISITGDNGTVNQTDESQSTTLGTLSESTESIDNGAVATGENNTSVNGENTSTDGERNTTINAGGNVNISYQGRDYGSNEELPGYKPSEGFEAIPSDLSKYRKANLLIEDMVISGERYIDYTRGEILIKSQLYEPIFKLKGSTNEQRVGFKLDSLQKAVLLQFGLQDLESGDTNFTYLVRISSDGKLLWAGECQYGPSRQIVSVPLSVSGARNLVIEYRVTEEGEIPNYQYLPLFFTKAEVLYE